MDHPVIIEHVKWMEQHPHFQKDMKHYLVLMKMLWASWLEMEKRDENFKFEVCANKWFDSDIRELKKLDTVSVKIKEREKRVCSGESSVNYAFITIGYNEQTITPALMKLIGQKVSEMKHWDTCKMVHEKHRLNGVHHHTHFLCTYTGTLYKTKILQYLMQLRLVKMNVMNQSFIDVKGSPDKATRYRDIKEFEKYIEGDKTTEKMECVEKDAFWRKNNNL